jgi:hypothetical protein
MEWQLLPATVFVIYWLSFSRRGLFALDTEVSAVHATHS